MDGESMGGLNGFLGCRIYDKNWKSSDWDWINFINHFSKKIP